jgi:septum formation protein
VTFESLSDEQIKFYIENYKPLDKAGSYGIQEMPDGYIKEYTGSLDNIIGLDVELLKRLLAEI